MIKLLSLKIVYKYCIHVVKNCRYTCIVYSIQLQQCILQANGRLQTAQFLKTGLYLRVDLIASSCNSKVVHGAVDNNDADDDIDDNDDDDDDDNNYNAGKNDTRYYYLPINYNRYVHG